MKNTVAGFARIQNTLNSGESSYDSWYILSCRSPLRLIGRLGVSQMAILALTFLAEWRKPSGDRTSFNSQP